MAQTIDQLVAWGKHLNVLYVEDDLSLSEEVRLFLSDIFDHIDTVANGQEGLDSIEKCSYDLVITDIHMPIMNGIEMIEKIKQTHPKLPIIVTSAHNESDYLIKLIQLGVDSFITKPLQSEQILNTLSIIVERIHTEQELTRYKNELEVANAQLSSLAKRQSSSLDLKTSILKAYQEAIDKATLVFTTDKHGTITSVNHNFCKATGYEKEELIGEKYNIIAHPSNPPTLFDEIWKTLIAKKTWQGLVISQTRTLIPLYHYKTIVPILDAQGDVIEYISVAQDLTELYKHNEEHQQKTLSLAKSLKEDELLKQIPFATALLSDELCLLNYNKLFEDLVNNHIDESLLVKLTTQKLMLKELVYFEEMDYFDSIEKIKSNWPYDGDITFKGTIKSIDHLHEILVRISPYDQGRYLICIIKQEDFELCCQVQER